MKTEKEIRNRLKDIEDYILQRFSQGHVQARLKDVGELQTLKWVLEDSEDLEETEVNSQESKVIGDGNQKAHEVSITPDTHSKIKEELEKDYSDEVKK